jgi:hypothetical protein
LLALAAELDVLLYGWYTGVWVSAPTWMVGLYYDWVAGRVVAAVWQGPNWMPVWSVVIPG